MIPKLPFPSRRRFLQTTFLTTASLLAKPSLANPDRTPSLSADDLPKGSAPAPLAFPHFPDRLSAVVWRNWGLLPLDRLARTLKTKPKRLIDYAALMGLPEPARNPPPTQRISLTIIRRNWHLLPYQQILDLLDWSPEELAFALQEDDFLFIKLGSLKPDCLPLHFDSPNRARREQLEAIATELSDLISLQGMNQPLLQFENPNLSPQPIQQHPAPGLRLAYSYASPYGDPLLQPHHLYPDWELEQLAAAGVNAIWLQGLLSKLTPFPWAPDRSRFYAERLRNLSLLVKRAREFNLQVFLYLNEPRSLPLAFFQDHPQLRGVSEGDHAVLCTSHYDVKQYLTKSLHLICETVPALGGFFTISASENLTNCWSHGNGQDCSRCAAGGAAAVITNLHHTLIRGIRQAGTGQRLIAWDWGWQPDWAPEVIRKLPEDVDLMSVSEWDLPIERGGIENVVGEYSISAIGPGPRARSHWQHARENNLTPVAKLQVGTTWELSAVPYLPALENVAQHIAALRAEGIQDVMLSWTLGSYPSPNLQVATLLLDNPRLTPHQALEQVAHARYGAEMTGPVLQSWKLISAAFSEFPFHIQTLYTSPLQFGPANLLYSAPTGYQATMIGFPYDDLDRWRANYPPDIFVRQLEKVSAGFHHAANALQETFKTLRHTLSPRTRTAVESELRVQAAAAIHFQSTANQARWIAARSSSPFDAATARDLLLKERNLARRLFLLQQQDGRIGFEASNHYYYTPADLLEKILNCTHLLKSFPAS